MTIIETSRLSLRRLVVEDAPFIFELTNDPEWIRFIGDRGIRTMEDARDYIVNGPIAMYTKHGFGLFAVIRREDALPIGMCGLLRRAWLEETDIGFAFLPKFRGLGYAYEAAAATTAFARSIGLRRLLAIVAPQNLASIRLLEKLGMKFDRVAIPPGEGTEVAVYGLTLSADDAIAVSEDSFVTR